MNGLSSAHDETKDGLPPGWIQHYDNQRNMPYYVNLNVAPPLVLLTHPNRVSPLRGSAQTEATRLTTSSSLLHTGVNGQAAPLKQWSQRPTHVSPLYADAVAQHVQAVAPHGTSDVSDGQKPRSLALNLVRSPTHMPRLPARVPAQPQATSPTLESLRDPVVFGAPATLNSQPLIRPVIRSLQPIHAQLASVDIGTCPVTPYPMDQTVVGGGASSQVSFHEQGRLSISLTVAPSSIVPRSQPLATHRSTVSLDGTSQPPLESSRLSPQISTGHQSSPRQTRNVLRKKRSVVRLSSDFTRVTTQPEEEDFDPATLYAESSVSWTAIDPSLASPTPHSDDPPAYSASDTPQLHNDSITGIPFSTSSSYPQQHRPLLVRNLPPEADTHPTFPVKPRKLKKASMTSFRDDKPATNTNINHPLSLVASSTELSHSQLEGMPPFPTQATGRQIMMQQGGPLPRAVNVSPEVSIPCTE